MHLHWTKYHHTAGVNRYYECRCGKRDVVRGRSGASPLDVAWLKGGESVLEPKVGPVGPSGVSQMIPWTYRDAERHTDFVVPPGVSASLYPKAPACPKSQVDFKPKDRHFK